MEGRILDGKAMSEVILGRLDGEVKSLRRKGIVPKLVVIQVGDDPASTIYVNKKHKACLRLGIESEIKHLPEETRYEDLIDAIVKLNNDDSVHGILVQLPLPEHLSHKGVLEAVDPAKDVDGLNPYNHGKNLLGKECFQPATPRGIISLIESTKTELEGINAVVIGRSNIVGKPTAIMLLNRGCTVTVCHSKTRNLSDFTQKADLLIVAAGKPGLVKAHMVKNGAIVIDVGINRLEGGKIVGDVDFDEVRKKAAWITPVPGGVGPMTIASLMENTIRACREYA